MAKDHRIIDAHSGNRISYTCTNSKFRTNRNKGFQHGENLAKGSVFKTPLINNYYSLWLEHVEEIDTGDEVYWLMWYDKNGWPTIPLSGIIYKNQIGEMVKQLSGFIP